MVDPENMLWDTYLRHAEHCSGDVPSNGNPRSELFWASQSECLDSARRIRATNSSPVSGAGIVDIVIDSPGISLHRATSVIGANLDEVRGLIYRTEIVDYIRVNDRVGLGFPHKDMLHLDDGILEIKHRVSAWIEHLGLLDIDQAWPYIGVGRNDLKIACYDMGLKLINSEINRESVLAFEATGESRLTPRPMTLEQLQLMAGDLS